MMLELEKMPVVNVQRLIEIARNGPQCFFQGWFEFCQRWKVDN